jgi:hypothetical protein
MQKMIYLLVSQHISGIIMPIIRKMVQNRQCLWCTALAVLQKTRGEEMVGAHLLGMVLRLIPNKCTPTTSSATQPVLYTIGAVDFVPFS